MQLTRPKPARPLISLVSMIDVLLIMLVFFMVTSTYLHLDMIPVVETADEAAPASNSATSGGGTVLLSLGADGRVTLSGQRLEAEALEANLRARATDEPDLNVLILPSGHAKTQALVSVMDAVTRAGITRLRIIELEAKP